VLAIPGNKHLKCLLGACKPLNKVKQGGDRNSPMNWFIFDPKPRDDGQHNYFPICVLALQKVTGSFGGKLRTSLLNMVRELGQGMVTKDQLIFAFSEERRQISSKIRDSIAEFLSTEIYTFSDNDPTSDTQYFSHGELQLLYESYVSCWADRCYAHLGVFPMDDYGNGCPCGSVQYFGKVLKEDFGQFVKMPKRMNKFSHCAYCESIKEFLTTRNTHPASRTLARQRLLRHFKHVRNQRIKYRKHKIKAKLNPHQ
jgi:hypothetical protein